jgi:heparan-alpha-glucosaminide N-acetyltransferase-like protein
MNPGERITVADLLKGVAVILMIQVHILELFSRQEIFDSTIGSLLLFLGGPPAAPVFLIVMGFFIAKGHSNLKASMKRGVKLIGIGLLLNIGLNIHLLIKIIQNDIIVDALPYLFGADILFIAGLSIIILGILRYLFNDSYIPYIITIIIVLAIPELISPGIINQPYLAAFIYSDVWWSYFPVIPWLIYPVTGYLFYSLWPKLNYIIKKKYIKFIFFLSSFVILFLSVKYGIRIASNLSIYYHHGTLFFLFSINFMIFWLFLFHFIANRFKNSLLLFMQWIGKNVTVFYIIQWLIIGNIATGIYKTQNGFQSVIWFMIVFILTTIITFIWNKILDFYKGTTTILTDNP